MNSDAEIRDLRKEIANLENNFNDEFSKFNSKLDCLLKTVNSLAREEQTVDRSKATDTVKDLSDEIKKLSQKVTDLENNFSDRISEIFQDSQIRNKQIEDLIEQVDILENTISEDYATTDDLSYYVEKDDFDRLKYKVNNLRLRIDDLES